MRSRSRLRTLQGLVLAAGAPLGWLTLRAIAGHPPAEDIGNDWALYLYLWIPTTAAFGIFGAVLGSHEDELGRISKRFEDEAVTDPLTGLHNRRYLRARLDEALSEASREGSDISIALFDLDHFKEVNDNLGHATGDLVLRRVGQAIEDSARAGETSARTGGEEFALILPEASLPQALEAAERVRRRIGQVRFPMGEGPERISASAGVATGAGQQSTPERLLEAADQALYRAKRNGRDRIEGIDLRRPVPQPRIE